MAQLAALLQLTQLWTVLAGLTPAADTAANVADADYNAQRILAAEFWKREKQDAARLLQVAHIEAVHEWKHVYHDKTENHRNYMTNN